MKIKVGRPWFTFLITRFIGEPGEDTVFTYGKTIFASRVDLSGDVLAHENLHRIQQGRFPSIWWARYLLDRDFRLQQEAEAYREQFVILTHNLRLTDRNARARALAALARALSSKLYGYLTDQITAKQLIEARV